MKRLLLAVLALFGMSAAHADPVELRTGQVWTFENAPAEETRIIIGDIEPFDDDVAVSVSILGVPFQKIADGRFVGGAMYHLPFSETALKPALLELVSENEPLPAGYSDGYEMWKEAVERGEAGIFIITPADILESVGGIISGKD